MVQSENSTNQYAFANSGLAFNTEINFGKLTKLKGKLKNYLNFEPYVFGDLGGVHLQGNDELFDQILYDAGIGLQTKISFYYLDIKPIIIRTELPLLIRNDHLYNGNKFLISLGKSI